MGRFVREEVCKATISELESLSWGESAKRGEVTEGEEFNLSANDVGLK